MGDKKKGNLEKGLKLLQRTGLERRVPFLFLLVVQITDLL